MASAQSTPTKDLGKRNARFDGKKHEWCRKVPLSVAICFCVVRDGSQRAPLSGRGQISAYHNRNAVFRGYQCDFIEGLPVPVLWHTRRVTLNPSAAGG